MGTGATPQIENLTETLQRHLGLQQAQTFWPEDLVADAIARLVRRRGDVERVRRLWDRARAHELVEGFRSEEHREALDRLRGVLDANLVVQRQRDGSPKTFRPFCPELVTHQKIGTVFRELGRTVVDVLWRDDEVKKGVETLVRGWRTRHPLALALTPLTVGVDEPPSQPSNLAELLRTAGDTALDQWVETVVRQDWTTWLRSAPGLSVDEQLETMTALVCLHLHVALLSRLWAGSGRPIVFLAVAGQDMDRACARSAYNVYGFWGDRAYQALRRVAVEAVDLARTLAPGWESLATTRELAAWAAVPIKGARSVNERFHQLVSAAAMEPRGVPCEALIDALTKAFSTPSGVATKVRDFLRGTGRAAGIVGPDAYRARKRYQLDERAIDLLARLHVHRPPDEVASAEEEKRGIDAFLDDVFQRYGFVVTRERGPVREILRGEALRPILRLLPGDEAMRRNRVLLERRFDDLRLVRRYSDASAVLHVV
jgi:hypothetical protein